MEKKVREFHMNNDEGTLHDIMTIYKWLGNISNKSVTHKFNIHFSIIETKDIK